MDHTSALEHINKACQAMSAELVRMHPAVQFLEGQGTKDDFYRALHELTRQVEAVKKLARKAGQPS